jgi:glycosyltransferase involved in cell wall biosynthesis
MPEVSVLIPNYNHARFLDKRIQSVLNQTFRDIEVIYLDDASTDHSNEIAHKYKHDARIRFIYNEHNSGNPFKQWNKGVREATGKYIWIAESDDFADERFLERLVDVLETDSQIGIAYCQSQCVDENDTVTGTMEWWTQDLDATRWTHDFQNAGRDECRRFLVQKNTLPNASAVVFRRALFEQAGNANEEMKVCGDWMFWAQCLLNCDLAFVAEPLNFFRSHARSVRSRTEENGLVVLESFQVIEFIAGRCDVSAAALHSVGEKLSNHWLKLALEENSRVPRARNLQIYLLARRFNGRLHPLIARRSAGALRRRLKVLARKGAKR